MIAMINDCAEFILRVARRNTTGPRLRSSYAAKPPTLTEQLLRSTVDNEEDFQKVRVIWTAMSKEENLALRCSEGFIEWVIANKRGMIGEANRRKARKGGNK